MLLRNKIEIENWLNQYGITNYELIPDEKYGYVVNVLGYVDLIGKNLESIEVKFNIIDGNLNCSENKLEDLNWCPEIVYGNVNFYNNKLKDLKNAPKIIKGFFSVSSNEVVSLIGCPEIINSDFYCYGNKLTSLKGFPKKIKGELFLNDNNLSIEEMNEIKFLEDCKIINLQGNEMLGELQYVNDINEIKKILNIYNEKIKLNSLIIINNDEIIKENRIKI